MIKCPFVAKYQSVYFLKTRSLSYISIAVIKIRKLTFTQYYCLCTNLTQISPIIPIMFFMTKGNRVSHVVFTCLISSVSCDLEYFLVFLCFPRHCYLEGVQVSYFLKIRCIKVSSLYIKIHPF